MLSLSSFSVSPSNALLERGIGREHFVDRHTGVGDFLDLVHGQPIVPDFDDVGIGVDGAVLGIRGRCRCQCEHCDTGQPNDGITRSHGLCPQNEFASTCSGGIIARREERFDGARDERNGLLAVGAASRKEDFSVHGSLKFPVGLIARCYFSPLTMSVLCAPFISCST